MFDRWHSFIRAHPFRAYLGLAFGCTWVFSTVVYFSMPISGPRLPAWLAAPAGVLWYFGPCLAALMIAQATGMEGGARGLLRRWRLWRVNWIWYAFIVGYPLALHLAVAGLDRLLGGPAPVFFQAAGVPDGNIPLTLIGLFVFQILVRGLGEETGWRGFALPQLQTRYPALPASALLGLVWALWHFHPANLSVLLTRTGLFNALNIALTTVIFTWVYQHTRGSLLIAGLFHAFLNLAEYIIPLGYTAASLTRAILHLTLLLLTVLMLALTYGPQLRGENSHRKETHHETLAA